MSFFVEKLGPLPGEPARKEQKSAAGADLLKNPSKATAQSAKQQAQAAKSPPQPQRAQAERAPQQKVVERAPPPKDDPPKKKKGWFG